MLRRDEQAERFRKESARPAPKTAPKPKVGPKPSPFAPARFPRLPPIAGVRLAAGRSGETYRDRDDLLVGIFAEGTQAAGVFTTSRCPSAPVDWCRANFDKSSDGTGRVLVVNSGNANAFTGRAGAEAAKTVAAEAARLAGCRQRNVFLASTGVIGKVLDGATVAAALPALAESASEDAFEDAARAIMTTDTYPKGATASAEIDGVKVTINGIAKGSGMIAPDMATMLAFVFTDAAISAEVLQTLLILTVRDSFNAITVDGDTSTSDTVLAFATGGAGMKDPIRRIGDRRLAPFREALESVMRSLAHQIVRDGEGAQKFIAVKVTGAENTRAARTIALSIANSPLVKTAIAGEDANWGRIAMAVGKAGEAADRDKLAIRIGGHSVARNGLVSPTYDEAKVTRHLKGREISIAVDVGVGAGEATVWTCDLTHEYIAINVDYRS
ncbi:MAG: bifunctional glutamate N-acetyltransferase/amino-acid acetyltransferase ArgJ [Alphaproteobacteria bacterium]|nr:bifunctional glutamate N-acetyltransferase/amino-acid acetyltransferase ArgJ [Alphaproteobacteria bacterium]